MTRKIPEEVQKSLDVLLKKPKRRPWWHYMVYAVAIGASAYIPLVHSPEMTNAQLLLNYWWFYLLMPLFVSTTLIGRD